jgi:hypothetical protein
LTYLTVQVDAVANFTVVHYKILLAHPPKNEYVLNKLEGGEGFSDSPTKYPSTKQLSHTNTYTRPPHRYPSIHVFEAVTTNFSFTTEG